MTTTKTTKTTGTKAATKASRVTRVTDASLRDQAASLVADITSGAVTGADAVARIASLDATLGKTTVMDTAAILRTVGALAVSTYTASGNAPADGKAKVPSAQTIADQFVTTETGKALGRQAGSVKQAVDVYRVVDLWTNLDLWQTCMAKDGAKDSDPKAYAMTVQAFLRWNAARKANRVTLDTGVVFASKDAAASGDGDTAAVLSATLSEAAKAKAKRAHTASVKNARTAAKASDATIGKIKVADVAALTPAQRANLVKLIKTLD